MPTVEGRATSAEVDAAVTSHTVALPDGISTGELLVAVVGIDSNATLTFTWPSGWTVIDSGDGDGTRARGEVAYHVVTGTEGFSGTGDTITVTTSEADESAHASVLISGHDNTQAPEGLAAEGSSNSPDAPSVTPTGGAKDYLWLWFWHSRNGADITSFPTNYVNGQQHFGTGEASVVNAGSAERSLNAASEDPAAASQDVSRPWSAYTVAVHPAAAGGTTVTPAAMSLSASLPAASPVGVGETSPAVTDAGLSIPAVSPAGAASSAPSTITSSVVVPQSSPTGGGNVTPVALELAANLHAVTTITGGSPATVTPDVLAAQLSLAQATPAGAANVSPAALSAALNLPAVDAEGLILVSPAALETAVSLHQVSLVGAATVTVDTLELEVVFGVPVSGESVDHPTGRTSVVLDASTTDAGVVAAITSVSLDKSRTFVSLDKTRTDT